MVLPLVDERRPKCYMCHEGFDTIDALREHQGRVHRDSEGEHKRNVGREPAPGDVTVF